MPHLQNAVSDIKQTLLSICESIIFSSSQGETDQFENAGSSARFHPGKTAVEHRSGRIEEAELETSSVAADNAKVSVSVLTP